MPGEHVGCCVQHHRTKEIQKHAVAALGPANPGGYPTPKVDIRAAVVRDGKLLLVRGRPATSIETDGVGWFERTEIPPLSVGRVTVRQIARLFEHCDQPDLPADFD